MEEFKRKELKYLVPLSRYIEFRKVLEPLCMRDAHAPHGPYNVYSIYFDTVSLKYYYDKIDGFENRLKYRVRFYDNEFELSKNKFFTLEVKEKVNDVMMKRRVQISLDEVNELISRKGSSFHGFLGDEFSEMEFERLSPVVQTSYKRDAFYHKNHPTLRITFDYLNTGSPFDCFGKKIFNIKKPLIPETIGILEIKAFGVIPSWLSLMIKQFNLKQEKVSKYCLAVDKWQGQMINARELMYG